jgi:hypothetical protein
LKGENPPQKRRRRRRDCDERIDNEQQSASHQEMTQVSCSSRHLFSSSSDLLFLLFNWHRVPSEKVIDIDIILDF